MSHWLREDVHWMMDRVFRRTFGLNGFETLFSNFSTEFFVFGC